MQNPLNVMYRVIQTDFNYFGFPGLLFKKDDYAAANDTKLNKMIWKSIDPSIRNLSRFHHTVNICLPWFGLRIDSGMPLVKIPDVGGDTLSVFEIDSRYYPPFPEEALRGVSSFKIRHDDVIVCAYPKSGTHWVWEMVRFLLAGDTNLEIAEKDDGFIEMFPHDVFDALESPRTLNTHYWFDQLPTEVLEKKPKIVFLLRNPKDIAVSYFHHHKGHPEYYEYNGSWHNYLQLILDGKVDYDSWFDYVLQWEKAVVNHPELNVQTMFYEDFKEDVLREVKKLARFLGKDYDDEFLKSVCQACSFDEMRKTKGHFQLDNDGNSVIYRKGEVGDWKNWFTVAQSEHFDKIYENKLKHSNLKLRFFLNK